MKFKFVILSLSIHIISFYVFNISMIKTNELSRQPDIPISSKITPVTLIPSSTLTNHSCLKSYNGIGLTFDPSTNTIIDVPDQLPAFIAGIRIGDVIIQPWIYSSNSIQIKVQRYDKIFKFTIPQSKICYN